MEMQNIFLLHLGAVPYRKPLNFYNPEIQTLSVQLGYCDSDVTACLLFWNMPVVQDGGVKFPYKRYYLQAY